jgi:predicted DNA-binding transcriptional regulator AlpA
VEEYLSSGEVARILEERGVMSTRTFPSYVSIRAWELGRIPEPDAVIGRRFYGWRRSTIERWLWERETRHGGPDSGAEDAEGEPGEKPARR